MLAFVAVCAALVSLLFIGGDPHVPAGSQTPTTEQAATPTPDPIPTVAAERADPVLSRARAALQAGRLESPQGRNALDLFEAVLLAQPDHVEARAGLAKTIDALLGRARSNAAAGRKAEAERVLQRVLAVDPEHEGAKAPAARGEPARPALTATRSRTGGGSPPARTARRQERCRRAGQPATRKAAAGRLRPAARAGVLGIPGPCAERAGAEAGRHTRWTWKPIRFRRAT